MKIKSLLILPLAILALPLVLTAQTTPVTQLQNLAHAVESLDKTVPFYRDVIGLSIGGRDPLAAQPQALTKTCRNLQERLAQNFVPPLFVFRMRHSALN
jgi:hypothetical protein